MNPFILSAYAGPEYFCDRQQESGSLINGITNSRNTVVTSLRRMGKTGLIRHVFYSLEKDNNYYLVYLDIDQTNSLNDFVNKLANSLLRIKRKSVSDKIIDFLKQFRPIFTFHPVTGMPEVEIRASEVSQDSTTIEAIFYYLEKLEKPVVLAIDEFQRINFYKEQRVEAILRSYIQHLQNVRFIFSGSSRNILASMFGDHSRPFYQSASFLHLERLDIDSYTDFVFEHFRKSGRSINSEDIKTCIDWTANHTFYSQYLFNSIWGSGLTKINSDDIAEIEETLLTSRDFLYMNYRNLLSENQFQLLKALALEVKVEHPNASEFLKSHNLGSASTINSALKTLIEKELVYYESGHYQVYDVFQAQWFRKNSRS